MIEINNHILYAKNVFIQQIQTRNDVIGRMSLGKHKKWIGYHRFYCCTFAAAKQ